MPYAPEAHQTKTYMKLLGAHNQFGSHVLFPS